MLSSTFLIEGHDRLVAAPLIAPYGPAEQDYDHVLEGSSISHPFGTDNFGRDIFSRVLYGARISLSVGVLGVCLGLLVGGILGLVAGHRGGWLDDVLMRVLDLLLAFPQLLLAIMVITVEEMAGWSSLLRQARNADEEVRAYERMAAVVPVLALANPPHVASGSRPI